MKEKTIECVKIVIKSIVDAGKQIQKILAHDNFEIDKNLTVEKIQLAQIDNILNQLTSVDPQFRKFFEPLISQEMFNLVELKDCEEDDDYDDKSSEIDDSNKIQKDFDQFSDISEPHYDTNCDDLDISDPDDFSGLNEDFKGIEIPTSNDDYEFKKQFKKDSSLIKLEKMKRLDKIWSQIASSDLQSYNPNSNEFQNILSTTYK